MRKHVEYQANQANHIPLGDNTRCLHLTYDHNELFELRPAQKWINNNTLSSIPRDIRKRTRGRRGGVRLKMRSRKDKPFMPPITFGNCRSLHNKIDELRLNTKFMYQYRETCCIALTESWLTEVIPDAAVEIPNFTLIRADRDTATCKKSGGGVVFYINDTWCNNISIKSKVCTRDIELLSVNLRPHYLPREFSNIYITQVYIPPSANKALAAELLSETINKLSDEKPDALQIVLGDVNRCELNLGNFTQYVTCPTRQDQILDHFYCNVKEAYRATQGAPLKNSDHNMIYMQPVYRRKLSTQKPKDIDVMQYSDDSLETLNSSFDQTD